MSLLESTITITLFKIDDIETDTQLIVDTLKTEYTIEKLIVGKHTDAPRPHYHIGIVVTYTGKQYLKHFNRKLTQILKDLSLENKKISTKNKDDPIYNADMCLMYPLKESEHTTTNHQLYTTLSFGISEDEYTELHTQATNQYDKIRAKRDLEQQQKLKEKDNTIAKYQHLDDSIDTKNIITFRENTIEYKIKYCLSQLLKYQRIQFQENDKLTFRINSMMDLTLSYLYNRHHIDEEELIRYKFHMLYI